MDEIKYNTTLGKLKGHEIGIDAEGDIMALAMRASDDRLCVLVIRSNGNFEVHEMDQVPMDWPVRRSKLAIIAIPDGKD
jgi:hypothetical protein